MLYSGWWLPLWRQEYDCFKGRVPEGFVSFCGFVFLKLISNNHNNNCFRPELSTVKACLETWYLNSIKASTYKILIYYKGKTVTLVELLMGKPRSRYLTKWSLFTSTIMGWRYIVPPHEMRLEGYNLVSVAFLPQAT